MMRHIFRAAVVSALLALPAAAAEGRTRYFPAQKCQFTLPTAQWSWVDQPAQSVFFAAKNANGLIVQTTYAPAAAWSQMDERAAEDFEASLARSSGGQLKKRGTSYVPFHGLTCYQIAGVLPDGKTTVSRCFLAHEMAYHILIVGGKDPVEQDPEFEAIMSGFAFTAPPAPAPIPRYGFNFSVFLVLLVFCLLLARLRRSLRSPKRPKLRIPPPDFDDALDVVRADPLISIRHTGIQTTPAASAGYAGSPARRDAPCGPFASSVKSESRPGAGECRHCGYGPVAFGAEECPRCAGRDPNPGVASRLAGRGGLIGALLGVTVGGIWGYLAFADGGVAGALGGALLGSLPGVVLGLATGLIAGLTARALGRR